MSGKRYEHTFDLDSRHVAGKIGNAVCLGPVRVVRGVMPQQIGAIFYAELFVEQLGSFGSDSFQKFYVCAAQPLHVSECGFNKQFGDGNV